MRILGPLWILERVWPVAREHLVSAPTEQQGALSAHVLCGSLVDLRLGDHPVQISVRRSEISIRGNTIERHYSPAHCSLKLLSSCIGGRDATRRVTLPFHA